MHKGLKLKKIALITLGLSGLFLVNSAHADVTRDAAKQTVTDSQTTLQWEDNIANKDKKMTQPAAVKYCINLSFAGHDDWRLPKLKELEDLAKATKVKFPKKPILKIYLRLVEFFGPHMSL